MKKQKTIFLLLLIAFSITTSAQLELEGKHERSLDFRGTWGVRILLPTAYDLAFPDGSGVNAENFDIDAFMAQIDQLTTITHVNINISRGHQSSWYSSPYPEMEAIMGSDLFPERDFFGEIVDALVERDIKVMVYFSKTGMDGGYLTAAQMVTWRAYLASEGLTHHEGVAKIVEYYAVKFGNKIDGWWIDRAASMTTEEHGLYTSAVRTGNPDAMVAFHIRTGMPIRQGTKFCDYTAGHPVPVNSQPTWTLSNVGMVENIEAGPWIDQNGNPDDSEGTALGAILMPFQEKWRNGAANFPTDQAIEWTIRSMEAGGMYSWAIAREGNGFAAPQFSQLLDINAAVDAYLNDETGNVTSISVTPETTNLFLNNTIQLTTNVIPFNATNKTVNWSSNDSSVATVDENGLVTGKIVGTATITATTEDGGFTDTCVVTVTSPAAGDNLALFGIATQSETLSGAEASRAIDGNTDGVFVRGSVIAAAGPDAWWQVELDNTYNINSINVFNRTACCEDRLADFTVYVLNGTTITYEQRITEIPAPSVTINAGGAVGTIVRIESNLTATINIAEVEVFGEIATLSVDTIDEANDKFLVHPNPVSNTVTIDFKGSTSAKLEIISYLGKTVMRSSAVEYGSNTFNLSGLASGLYIVKVSDEKESYTSKLIKK